MGGGEKDGDGEAGTGEAPLGRALQGKGFPGRFVQGWEKTVGVTTIQRRHALRTMLVRAEAAGEAESPWESVSAVAGADEHFDG